MKKHNKTRIKGHYIREKPTGYNVHLWENRHPFFKSINENEIKNEDSKIKGIKSGINYQFLSQIVGFIALWLCVPTYLFLGINGIFILCCLYAIALAILIYAWLRI